MGVKVTIDRDRDGWRYQNETRDLKSPPHATYGDTVKAALAAGHEIDNAGWLHRMLMWNFNMHAIDGYPGWEREGEHPAYAQLVHVRGVGPVESTKLATAWDDVATVDFYQRDFTDDGLPCVSEDDTYRSGWWFATIAERDRFLKWRATV